MVAPLYTANYILSTQETPIYPGTCVICIDGSQVIRYTATNASNYQGRQIGVTVGQALPGVSVPVVTAGQVSYNLCNLGAGSASLVAASAGSPQRGSSGDTIGVCDKSGSLLLYPSFCGVKVAPNQTNLVATGSGVMHVTANVVDSAASVGASNQLLVTNASGTDTTWVSLSGDGAIASGVLTVTGLQGKSVSGTAPTGGQTLIFNSGNTWAPTSISGDGTLSSAGVLTVASLSGSSGTTSLKSNLNPSADNTYGIGTNALRLTAVSALSYKVYNAASDAQPSVNITTQQIALGVGGSTATDVRLRRSATTTLTLDDTAGNAANLVPPSNFVGQLGTTSLQWLGVTAKVFAIYGTAGDANPVLSAVWNSTSQAAINWGAGGASNTDTRLERTAAHTLTIDDGASGSATLSNPNVLSLNGANGVQLQYGTANRLVINNTNMTFAVNALPSTDINSGLGLPTQRFSSLYAYNVSITSSGFGGNSNNGTPLQLQPSTINNPNTLNLVTSLSATQLSTPYLILTGTINSTWTLQFGSGASGIAGVWLVDVSQIAITSVNLVFQAGASGATATVSSKTSTTNLIAICCDGAGHIAVNA